MPASFVALHDNGIVIPNPGDIITIPLHVPNNSENLDAKRIWYWMLEVDEGNTKWWTEGWPEAGGGWVWFAGAGAHRTELLGNTTGGSSSNLGYAVPSGAKIKVQNVNANSGQPCAVHAIFGGSKNTP